MNRLLRIGTLGAARITPNALIRPAQATPEVQVVAIAARDEMRARAFAAKYKIERVHSGYAALIDDPDIDVIYNPLPNSYHFEWTMRALQAGKHVLCEKPMASNADEAEQMADMAQQTGLVLMEAFHNLYHPLAARMKAIIKSGELGALRHVEAHFCTLLLRPHDIRYQYDLAGGALMDTGCYTIRLLRFLTDAEPEAVTRASAMCCAPQVDCWMEADLRFPQGVIGRMTCSLFSPVLPRISARVVGESGEMWVLNPLHPHLFHWLRIRGPKGVRNERVAGETTYTHQLRAFVQAVQNKTPLLTDGNDGVANMRVIDAVYIKAQLKPRGV